MKNRLARKIVRKPEKYSDNQKMLAIAKMLRRVGIVSGVSAMLQKAKWHNFLNVICFSVLFDPGSVLTSAPYFFREIPQINWETYGYHTPENELSYSEKLVALEPEKRVVCIDDVMI